MLKIISPRFITRRLSTSTRCLAMSLLTKTKEVWTEGNIVKSIHKDVEIPDVKLNDYIWNGIEKWPTKTAIVCGVTGRQFTYEQLYKLSITFGANLRRKFGIRDGDTVGVMLPNIPDYAVVLLGIISAGGIATTINPIYTAFEVSRQIQLSNPKVMVVSPGIVNVIKEALNLAKRDIPIITISAFGEDPVPGTAAFKELIEDVHVDKSVLNEVNRTSEDVCILPYSSGTTGLPKGVELTNKNLVANCCQMSAKALHLWRETTGTNQDSVLATLPLFHLYGLSVVMLHKLSVGLRIVTLPKFQPNVYLETLLKYKINMLLVAPPTVLFLGTSPDVRQEHLDNVFSVTSGAAPLPAADVKYLFEKAKRKLNFCQGYGLTETSPLATLTPIGHDEYGTVGWSVPNVELKLIDFENNVLGPNGTGELLIRGPSIMKGYKGNDQATKEAFTEDNFFKSGDLAKIDEFGVVTIVDRLKELIKVKGYQVAPAELENVLKDHDSVLDAAVVGVDDPTCGEVPRAFVVLKDGYKVKEEELLDFVSERVAPFKRIKRVTFLDSIPKNPSGKILRRVLKEEY